MAVYNLTNNNSGGNPWNYLAAKAVGGLLDHVISGMMERAAQAREAKRAADVYGGFQQAMSDPNAGREAFMTALSMARPNDRQAKLLLDLYAPRFENTDKLAYGDAVADRVGGLDYDVRKDPALAMQSAMTAQAYGMKPGNVMQYAYPNLVSQNLDLGDRYKNIAFDPGTGRQVLSDFMKGIDPEAKMVDETRRRGQDIDLYEHRTPSGSSLVPSYSTVTDKDGNIYTVNNRSGKLTPTGVQGVPKGQKQAAGTKPLTATQKLSLITSAQKMFNEPGALYADLSPEQKWNTLLQTVGNDPEALSVMAQTAFADGKVPKAAMEFFKSGNLRQAGTQTPAQAQAPAANQPAEYFPASRLNEFAQKHGMTAAQARAEIEKQGYAIK